MDPTQKPRPIVDHLDHHDFKKTLKPGEAERFEIHGMSFKAGAGVDLKDDLTGEWSVKRDDVQVTSPSTILVQRAYHGDAPERSQPDEPHNPLAGETPSPIPATLTVTVRSPGQPVAVNNFAIEFLDV